MTNPQDYLKVIRQAAEHVRSRACAGSPSVGIILGSGLSRAVPDFDESVVIPYSDIPGFPRATVAGHEGRLLLGSFAGRSVVVLQGRFHYYEGHPMSAVTLPVRVLASMGVGTLIVTAAVGSMRRAALPGRVVVIKDHINLMGRNPLRGLHEREFGTTFPDLKDAYDPDLRRLALRVCRKSKIPCGEGVYVAVPGPSYETPAEIKAFRALGGDVVGMSVVPEVIVARQMGIRVLAVSWVANMASGMVQAALTHTQVLESGERVSARLGDVLQDILRELEPMSTSIKPEHEALERDR